MFIAHRINSIKELLNIHSDYGIEVDLRDNIDGEVYISHDPFTEGELFKDYLLYFQHKFIILNIKSEGIEYKVIEYLKKFNIKNYFFLDSSFPMIYKLNILGEKNIALRYSEFESMETIIKMKNKVKWVWIDCFTTNPLNYKRYIELKNIGYKLCFVSPELQNQSEKIIEYKNYFENNNIELDAICTKKDNIYKWNKTEVQIIIPMSGLGQRFIDANYKNPKPLIEVDGKPIIQHVVELFPGENNIHFICNDKHLQETNMKQILEKICPHGKIHKVPVEGRMGPVHAVQLIETEIDDNKEVIVSYCDYGTYWNYKNFLKDTRDRNAEGSIACYKGFHPHMLGNDNYAFLKETNEGSRWMEAIQEKKPFTNNKMNEYASNGTYYFKNGMIMKKYFKKLMELEIKVKNEYYVSMVYNLLIEDNLKVNIFEIEHMLQWGTPYDLEIYKNWSNYFSNLTKKQDKYIDNFDTTLVLPLAGHGSRFSNKGYINPKPLLDVDGLPMIISAVKCLPKTTNKIFICLEEHLNKYPLEENIIKYYQESKVFGINGVTEGQACTTEIGIEKGGIDLDKPILVSACDNAVYYNVNKYQTLVDDIKNDIIVWSFRNEPTSKNNPNMYAWMTTDENDFITNVSCKKFIEGVHNIENSHVIIGTMFFRKARWFIEGLRQNYQQNIRSNNEFYVDDVLNQSIKNGLNIKVFEVDNYICWGTPDDYETYLYWQNYFDKCWLHTYRKILHTEKKNDYTIRTKCIICDELLFNEYFENDYKIPVACYSKENNSNNDIFIPYNIYTCENCKCIQTKYLGNLDEIYKINHADGTGSIMKILHLKVFNTIKEYKDKITNIVEIGSSKGLLSDILLENDIVDKYYIIEPSFIGKKHKNKIIINDYFENVDLKNIYANTIIISHVFEHFYNPIEILNKIKENDNINQFILVWPDLEYYKDNNVYHVLNTEHTFYIDNNCIIKLFNNFLFELVETIKYENHSVIFVFKRNMLLNKCKIYNEENCISNYYNNLFLQRNKIIDFINKNKNKNICLWPCSVHTQFLLIFLKNIKIDYILDNSPNKINKYIYGYNIKCLSFEEYKNNENYAIILNGGVFNKEVNKKINNINILEL